MNTEPTPDDERLADIVDLHRDDGDPLVDRYLAGVANSDQEPPGTDRALERLDDALPSPAPALRAIVAILAAVQLLAVVPWILGHDPFGLLGDSSSAHLTRDGSLGLVVSAAALLAAWRPHWSIPAFAIASITVIAQAAANALDDTVATGGNELIHLPSVALACLTGTLAIRLTTLTPRRPSRQ